MGKRVTPQELSGKPGSANLSPANRWTLLKDQTVAGGLTWSDADSQTLLQVIASVTEEGAALLLGRTSDGGALMLRIIDNNVSTPFYPANPSALNEVLTAILSALK